MVLAHIMQESSNNGIASVEYLPHQVASFSTRYYKIINTKTQVIYDIALDRDNNIQQYEETDEYVESEISIYFIEQLILQSKKSTKMHI